MSTADAEPNAVDRAHAHIREAIIVGTFPADSMLSEGALALELGSSRTPVRVALARLQDDGWVRIYPKRGALVRRLTSEEIADIRDARLVLETSGVMRATSEVRVQLAKDLAPVVEEQRTALSAGDVSRFIELTQTFHRAFLRAGANRYLIDLGDRLADRQRQLLFAGQAELRDRSDEIIDEHRQLLDALRADDPERFADVLRTHVVATANGDAGHA